jgi:ethanolamine ammonia-lyase large subunit|tara:strand:+ start:6774 stop:6953 length:180 start_codon:yes stop_codon:yes gene_type:complete
MSLIDGILESVLKKYGIEKTDIDKAKRVMDKIKFTKRNGENYLIIDIGDGVELSIKQKD